MSVRHKNNILTLSTFPEISLRNVTLFFVRAYYHYKNVPLCLKLIHLHLCYSNGIETVTLAEEINKYDTEKFIRFLRGQGELGLDEDELEIIRKERFLPQYNQRKLRSFGLGLGPASNITVFVKECKEKKLKAFSSYKSLEEVLEKYGIRSNNITSIPQFVPSMLTSDLYANFFLL